MENILGFTFANFRKFLPLKYVVIKTKFDHEGWDVVTVTSCFLSSFLVFSGKGPSLKDFHIF